MYLRLRSLAVIGALSSSLGAWPAVSGRPNGIIVRPTNLEAQGSSCPALWLASLCSFTTAAPRFIQFPPSPHRWWSLGIPRRWLEVGSRDSVPAQIQHTFSAPPPSCPSDSFFHPISSAPPPSNSPTPSSREITPSRSVLYERDNLPFILHGVPPTQRHINSRGSTPMRDGFVW